LLKAQPVVTSAIDGIEDFRERLGAQRVCAFGGSGWGGERDRGSERSPRKYLERQRGSETESVIYIYAFLYVVHISYT